MNFKDYQSEKGKEFLITYSFDRSKEINNILFLTLFLSFSLSLISDIHENMKNTRNVEFCLSPSGSIGA